MAPEAGATGAGIARRRLPLTAILILLFLYYPTAASAAPEPDARAAELAHIRSRMVDLRAELARDRNRESRTEKRLHATELAISELVLGLVRVEGELRASRSKLEGLRAERNQALERLDFFQQILARQLRSAYAVGKQGQVKMLLNQTQPDTVGRMYTYYRYLNEARAGRIQAVNLHLDTLERLTQEIDAQTLQLEALKTRRGAEKLELENARDTRSTALAKLRKQIRNKGRELQQLEQDEQRLQRLIRSLQEMLADIPAGPGQRRDFAQLKGQLSWPVAGTLRARFGGSRHLGHLKWRGVLIGAPTGSGVRAVARGRVAFADWLRGFGLLIILDHGDGYMSLYGHNQILHKEVGEWVQAGESIAAVGDSGGQEQAGLYFELRKDGQPVDPAHWCAGKPASRQVAR